MPTQPIPPGQDQPGARSAAKPGTDEVEFSTPPVDDDAGGTPPPADSAPADPPPRDNDDDTRHTEPQKPPSDRSRDDIADRFSKKRNDPPVSTPADGDDDDDSGNTGEPPPADKAGADIGKSAKDGEAQPADTLELKVFGKTQSKSIDEIAVLADMEPEEVRKDPERAIRYAQRELATTERLNEAKRIHREAGARTSPGDQDTRSGARAPDPDRDETDDVHGDHNRREPPADDRSKKVDFRQLVEALQLEDPEVAGEHLEKAFQQFAEDSRAAVTETVTHADLQKKADEDRRSSVEAMNEFAGEHPELGKNRYAHQLIGAGLIDEYREDLVKVMMSEGRDQDEAEQIANEASNDRVAEIHRELRVSGHPDVRKVDKGMFEKAYARATRETGIKPEPKPTSETLTDTRRARKEGLNPQPRRASTPKPGDEPTPRPASRSSIVAEMAAGRGQKGPSANR